MVELISPPDPRTLLPPLLACLPTAFVSPQPPPALLPLLSPILRQRVQVLSSVDASPTDSWLRLLTWDSGKAERLQSLVDHASFEPHPVSGEIELPGDIPVAYRRFDEETLQSRVLISDYSLKVTYLWCSKDEEGGGPGWRVAEVLPYEGAGQDDGIWSLSIGEANATATERLMEEALKAAEKDEKTAHHKEENKEEEDDDDDGYWAQYDATPGRTPSVKAPSVKPSFLSAISSTQYQGPSEASYYSRYDDVQPVMDSHDPEEEHPELGPSTLLGDLTADFMKRNLESSGPVQDQDESARVNEMPLNHPRPSSVSSASSLSVARLEKEAENQSTYEVGVKQHISSNIKSLFRLAKATGMSRAEFQGLVQAEIDLLNLSDPD